MVSRTVKTVIVEAVSRKDAIAKLHDGDGIGTDVKYDLRGYRVVGREYLLRRRHIKQDKPYVPSKGLGGLY